MSFTEVPGFRVPIRLWTDPATVEDGAMQQLRDLPPDAARGWNTFWTGFDELDPAVTHRREKAGCQLGTLGGGNHFIEICLETEADGDPLPDAPVWLMPHSGSRGIGNELARAHIDRARALPHNADLPDRDLAVFIAHTPQMAAYRRDLFWAQEYALRNRAVMLALLQSVVRRFFTGVNGRGRPVTFGEPISCHHNYVAEEIHDGVEVLVTRKGAIPPPTRTSAKSSPHRPIWCRSLPSFGKWSV